MGGFEGHVQRAGGASKPKQIQGVWICPIFSWYHGSFDVEPDLPGAADIEKVPFSVSAKSTHVRFVFSIQIQNISIIKIYKYSLVKPLLIVS